MPETAIAPRVLKAGAVEAAPVVAFLGVDHDAERHRQLQAELDAAVSAAYERGLTDGREAAENEGIAAIPRLAAGIVSAGERAAEAAAAQVSTDTASLLALATEVAAWMVHEHATFDPGVLIGRLELALEGLAATAPLEVEVAASQVAVVAEWAGAGAVVVGNPSLGAGDAIVRAGAATADLRLDEAVRRALAAFADGGSDV